jgi:hypothetical protein
MLAGAAVVLLAGCGGSTETVTVTRQETVTRTETVTPRPPSFVLVPLEGSHVAFMPKSIPLGVSNAITQIRWKRYGERVAIGTGVFPSNDCVPSCAQGTITPIKVTVRLAGVTPCPRSGLLMYRMIEIDGPGFDPGYEDLPDPPC